ncbi:MAG TPA: phosphate ABC transporter permease PstA [Candidatus Limnocylindrales bacterium]|nr:phosphate ABC transporter permease PstA [Candidatus Limnocylindrales bacterium]
MAARPRAQALSTADVVRQTLQGRRLDVGTIVFEGLLVLALVVTIGVLLTLLVDVFSDGLPVLASRGTEFLTSGLSSSPDRAGVVQGIVGSLLLMVFVIVLSFPIGVGAAVYLEEYARDTRLTRLVNTAIRNLAGVPAIVYGLLGVAIFVGALGGLTGGRTIISGGLTLAVLVLPIVIITTAEALRAVPMAIREAAFGVGATRWETVRSHVLPYAAPGIFTGTILSLARAFGETAPLIVVGAIAGTFRYSADNVVEQLRGPYTALPTIIYGFSRDPDAGFRADTAAAIIVLLVVLLAVNALAIILRNRFERRW